MHFFTSRRQENSRLLKCPDERHEHRGRGERTGPARESGISWLLDVLRRKRKKGSFRLPVWLAGWMVFAFNQLKLLQGRAV